MTRDFKLCDLPEIHGKKSLTSVSSVYSNELSTCGQRKATARRGSSDTISKSTAAATMDRNKRSSLTCLTALPVCKRQPSGQRAEDENMARSRQWITSSLHNSAGPLIVACICLLVVSTGAQPQLTRRWGPPRGLPGNFSTLFVNNTSSPLESAREYLGKFGWVEPADWTAISPRFNKSISEGGSFGRGGEDVSEIVDGGINQTSTVLLERDHFGAIPEDQFETALRNFQRANGLKVTGILDEDTMLTMTQLRCGVPDLTTRPNRTEVTSPDASDVTSSVDDTIMEELSDRPIDMPTFSGDDSMSTTAQTDATSPPTSTTFIPRLLRKRRQADDGDLFGLSLSRITEYYGDYEEAGRPVKFDEEDFISEAELPSQSRVESMEGILAALRKEKIGNKEESVLNLPPDLPPPRAPGIISRIVDSVRENEYLNRRKRSTVYQHFNARNGWGLAFAKPTITWRLVREWPSIHNAFMSANEVWFTVKLAFRMWSEIIPRNFQEDNTSPVSDVDVLIGFGTGKHNRCPVDFFNGPFEREYAHAWPLPKSEIHFNDAQPFVPVSWVPSVHTGTRIQTSYPISLLKVAIHEIGHTLGLPHSDNRVSVMNPFYQPFQSKDVVELSRPDRESISEIYGSCDVPFDVVFDWVRRVRKNGILGWKYNTYFFRRTWYWLYENRVHRPRYGDPKAINDYWRGALEHPHNKIDGIVPIRDWWSVDAPLFFFRGDTYVEYDSSTDRVKTRDKYGRSYPRRIAEDFPGIPYPIDTVFYKSSEGLLYFFKEDTVYRYSWRTGVVLDAALISHRFPGWGGASPLPSNIDAAYYSYSDQAYYFFKGAYYWKLAGSREREANRKIVLPYNSVGPRQRIDTKWKYICDVGESELTMNLPAS